ncbi:MAG: hypothetical protein MK086_14755, partial [Flavobacteriales bacterium]|nr:hypothetical protein [Flavobacteriales bacterium]
KPFLFNAVKKTHTRNWNPVNEGLGGLNIKYDQISSMAEMTDINVSAIPNHFGILWDNFQRVRLTQIKAPIVDELPLGYFSMKYPEDIVEELDAQFILYKGIEEHVLWVYSKNPL